MNLKPLYNFSENIVTKGDYEKRFMKEILENKLEYFYLEDFTKSQTINERVKLKQARDYLMSKGIIIAVIDSDTELNQYSNNMNEFCGFKNHSINSRGKIINITFQDLKKRITKYIERFPERDLSQVNFIEKWTENYNNWLKNYYPKINHRI